MRDIDPEIVEDKDEPAVGAAVENVVIPTILETDFEYDEELEGWND